MLKHKLKLKQIRSIKRDLWGMIPTVIVELNIKQEEYGILYRSLLDSCNKANRAKLSSYTTNRDVCNID